MSYLVSVLSIVTAVVWVCLAVPTTQETQAAVDRSCPARQPLVKYPQEMGGPHPAVCNPSGRAWREGTDPTPKGD
jgi:hypothetical protein